MTQVFVHLVWATRNRTPDIGLEVEVLIREGVGAQTKRLRSELLAFGASDDHVHSLVQLHPDVALATLVRAMKSASTMNVTRGTAAAGFHWQEGYGAFSVGADAVARVSQYIARQREHHAQGSTDAALESLPGTTESPSSP